MVATRVAAAAAGTLAVFTAAAEPAIVGRSSAPSWAAVLPWRPAESAAGELKRLTAGKWHLLRSSLSEELRVEAQSVKDVTATFEPLSLNIVPRDSRTAPEETPTVSCSVALDGEFCLGATLSQVENSLQLGPAALAARKSEETGSAQLAAGLAQLFSNASVTIDPAGLILTVGSEGKNSVTFVSSNGTAYACRGIRLDSADPGDGHLPFQAPCDALLVLARVAAEPSALAVQLHEHGEFCELRLSFDETRGIFEAQPSNRCEGADPGTLRFIASHLSTVRQAPRNFFIADLFLGSSDVGSTAVLSRVDARPSPLFFELERPNLQYDNLAALSSNEPRPLIKLTLDGARILLETAIENYFSTALDRVGGAWQGGPLIYTLGREVSPEAEQLEAALIALLDGLQGVSFLTRGRLGFEKIVDVRDGAVIEKVALTTRSGILLMLSKVPGTVFHRGRGGSASSNRDLALEVLGMPRSRRLGEASAFAAAAAAAAAPPVSWPPPAPSRSARSGRSSYLSPLRSLGASSERAGSALPAERRGIAGPVFPLIEGQRAVVDFCAPLAGPTFMVAARLPALDVPATATFGLRGATVKDCTLALHLERSGRSVVFELRPMSGGATEGAVSAGGRQISPSHPPLTPGAEDVRGESFLRERNEALVPPSVGRHPVFKSNSSKLVRVKIFPLHYSLPVAVTPDPLESDFIHYLSHALTSVAELSESGGVVSLHSDGVTAPVITLVPVRRYDKKNEDDATEKASPRFTSHIGFSESLPSDFSLSETLPVESIRLGSVCLLKSDAGAGWTLYVGREPLVDGGELPSPFVFGAIPQYGKRPVYLWDVTTGGTSVTEAGFEGDNTLRIGNSLYRLSNRYQSQCVAAIFRCDSAPLALSLRLAGSEAVTSKLHGDYLFELYDEPGCNRRSGPFFIARVEGANVYELIFAQSEEGAGPATLCSAHQATARLHTGGEAPLLRTETEFVRTVAGLPTAGRKGSYPTATGGPPVSIATRSPAAAWIGGGGQFFIWTPDRLWSFSTD